MSDPVNEFEAAFRDKIGARYAIAVNSGTSALHAALVACNVKDCEVIMPALCPAMDAFAIIHAGGTPVFADVDPLTHLVTAATIEKCITPKTKAIICVHLHGLACDMEPILKLAESHVLWLIEDCAQSMLATYNDRYVGTIGHIGCFSFERKKHMTTGSEGGMIVTSNTGLKFDERHNTVEDLAIKARKFSGIGYKHMTAEAGRTSLDASVYQRPDYERFDTIGLNYRMSHVQAEIGIQKLKTIDDVVSQRREIGYLWQFVFGESCQPHLYNAHNAFYTAAFPYMGDWLDLYKRFNAAGGDGFYAMPQCPWKEPAIKNSYHNRLFTDCPVAEELQKNLVLMKTHYPIVSHAKRQTKIMAEVL